MASWRDIADQVCKARNVPRYEVFSPMRYPKLVRARYEIMWRIRNETKLSFYQIAQYIGRDHATVLYGVRKWEKIRRE